MTAQLCIAPHRDNPPTAAATLKLCFGHHGALEDALTGPSAADDPTIDAVWGVRTWWGTAGYHYRTDALRALESSRTRYAEDQRQPRERRKWRQPPALLVGDSTIWIDPREYRPGGITRDWLALQRRGSTQATGEQAPYVSHGTDNPLPIDGRVAELRHDIPAVLRSWTGLHAQTFGVTPPASPSVGQLVTWLAIYRDHAAAQDWAGDYVRELAELRARARRLIDLPGPARAAVGPCPERTDGQPCTGTLYSDIREERDPRPSEVRCDTCGTGWDSTQWMRLGQRVAMVARGTLA